ncbi:hypothetical protein RND81_10G011200 [Saponaria officinalis]|uniref:Uncharacterized protein n=1 Tax=Saponaria officinalis TaxID=3572 RepID=A0AAW1HXN2_SAPOF
MTTLLLRNNNGYTKIDKEDPKEKSHREAQFIIYKTMKQVDQIVKRRSSFKPSWLKLRIFKLKVKIGNKLGLRKTMSKSKVGVCHHLMGHLMRFKRLFNCGGRHRRHGCAANNHHLPQPLLI